GTTMVTNTARDNSGNSGTCTFTVTVLDNQPPTITCPANFTVNTALGTCTSNVTFNVTATDNCAVTNTSSVPASGFAFPVGVTLVTSTASDRSGNKSQCFFTVTVIDNQPPQITCPSNFSINAAPGACTSNVTFTVSVTDSLAPTITCPANLTVNTAPGACTSNVTFIVSASDNCSVLNTTSSPASGFAFPIGVTTVTSTARDNSGNSSTCSFTVTVVGTPINITNQPVNVTACNGGTATFTAAASGTLPISVQWQANTGGGFANIPNATTTTLSVPANASTVG